MLNNKHGWRRFHFVSPFQGLVCFAGGLPRATLADSLCPGLSYFALSGRRKKFVPHPPRDLRGLFRLQFAVFIFGLRWVDWRI